MLYIEKPVLFESMLIPSDKPSSVILQRRQQICKFFSFTGSLPKHKTFILIDVELKYHYYHMREYYEGFNICYRGVFSYTDIV